jgi:predicted  nucleic acid-binding Zn-ribbon protein
MMESAWKTAARAWWERMRKAERERDELLQKLEELQKAAESVQKEPSGNTVEFADLAARIAEADAKHPRDLADGGWSPSHELRFVREALAENPGWSNALRCELEEALAELARGDMERLADELLDVATVAMRWRRAVMERAK